MELKGFAFYSSLIKILSINVSKFFFLIGIYFGETPTMKYFIVEMFFLVALGTKHFVLSGRGKFRECKLKGRLLLV